MDTNPLYTAWIEAGKALAEAQARFDAAEAALKAVMAEGKAYVATETQSPVISLVGGKIEHIFHDPLPAVAVPAPVPTPEPAQ